MLWAFAPSAGVAVVVAASVHCEYYGAPGNYHSDYFWSSINCEFYYLPHLPHHFPRNKVSVAETAELVVVGIAAETVEISVIAMNVVSAGMIVSFAAGAALFVMNIVAELT